MKKLMATERKRILPTFRLRSVTAAAFVMFVRCHYALNHTVGDSIWSIPPTKDFYSTWSADRFFRVGDSLVFAFETNFHDVTQVSKRHYESCSAESPLRRFSTGPATVPLPESGVYYFICSFPNHCLLGQKLSVVVHSPIPASPLQQPPQASPPHSTTSTPVQDSLPVPSSASASNTRPVVQPSESPPLVRSCSASRPVFFVKTLLISLWILCIIMGKKGI